MFETGCGNKRRAMDVNKIASVVGEEVAKSLPALHAFTGCDSTSAFVRKGKKGPYNIMKKDHSFISAFQVIGTMPDHLNSDTLQLLENFVCAMYGKKTYNDINKLCCVLFRSHYTIKMTKSLSSSTSSGIDLSLLPPCRGSLLKHCLRANYQAYIWRNSHIPNPHLPSPVGCGWTTGVDNKLLVDWIDGDAIPPQLVEILDGDKSYTMPNSDDDDDDDGSSEEVVEEDDTIDNILDFIYEDDNDFED